MLLTVADHYQSYVALGIIIPIVLVCMLVFLTVCAVAVYSVRARKRRASLFRARLYRQHQAALHAAGHFDDAVPYGQYSAVLIFQNVSEFQLQFFIVFLLSFSTEFLFQLCFKKDFETDCIHFVKLLILMMLLFQFFLTSLLILTLRLQLECFYMLDVVI